MLWSIDEDVVDRCWRCYGRLTKILWIIYCARAVTLYGAAVAKCNIEKKNREPLLDSEYFYDSI